MIVIIGLSVEKSADAPPAVIFGLLLVTGSWRLSLIATRGSTLESAARGILVVGLFGRGVAVSVEAFSAPLHPPSLPWDER